MSEKQCAWRQWQSWVGSDMDAAWDTGCGNAFEFMNDGPAENNFKFCPYCGGALVVSVVDAEADA